MFRKKQGDFFRSDPDLDPGCFFKDGSVFSGVGSEAVSTPLPDPKPCFKVQMFKNLDATEECLY